jgi:hypothetical protein
LLELTFGIVEEGTETEPCVGTVLPDEAAGLLALSLGVAEEGIMIGVCADAVLP